MTSSSNFVLVLLALSSFLVEVRTFQICVINTKLLVISSNACASISLVAFGPPLVEVLACRSEACSCRLYIFRCHVLLRPHFVSLVEVLHESVRLHVPVALDRLAQGC